MLTCFFQENLTMVSNNFSNGYMADYEEFCKEIDSIEDLSSEKIVEIIDRRNKEEAMKKHIASVQETEAKSRAEREEKISISFKAVEGLKADLFPVIIAKFNKLLLIVIDEQVKNQKLTVEKAAEVSSLFQETAKKHFNVEKEWEAAFSEVRTTLTEDYWEDAMKHHAFLLMFGIGSQKEELRNLFNVVIENNDAKAENTSGSLHDAEIVPPSTGSQNNRPKSNK